jgi:hypothetical protein
VPVDAPPVPVGAPPVPDALLALLALELAEEVPEEEASGALVQA